MENDLTQGPVMKTMLRFAVPMILGDLLQQCYNIADTVIVGQFLGTDALAAVGSSFALMTFLTSVLLGLSMGSGTVFSIRFGQGDRHGLKEGILASFVLLGAVTVVLSAAIFAGLSWIIQALRTPGGFGAAHPGVPTGDLFRDGGHFPLQLFRLPCCALWGTLWPLSSFWR